MDKTGISSIDNFFGYGQQHSKVTTYPFTPLISTVLEMFSSEYTSNLHDRKAKAIINFCKQRQYGFYYQEIESLTVILEHAKNDLFGGVEQMIAAIEAILAVDTPDPNNIFNKNASSDQLRYLPILPAFLDALDPFLNYHQYLAVSDSLQSLRHSVVLYLQKFAEREIPQILKKEENFENKKSELEEVSPISILRNQGTKNLRAMAASHTINSLIQLLANYQTQTELIHPLLDLFSALMMYKNLAAQLCHQGIIKLAFEILILSEDFRSSLVNISLQIIWSGIESLGVECLGVLAHQQYIWAVRDIFLRVIREGYKLEDKCLRNQLLILINYLLSLPEAISLFLTKSQSQSYPKESSFLEVLFHFATTDEARFYDTKARIGDRKVQFGTSAQDLQLKKLFWSGLLTAIESNNQEVLSIAIKSDFTKYLLIYIDSANSGYAVTRWSPPQLRELQQHVLTIISNIILYMKNDFEDKKGIFCLTKFLSNVTDIDRRQKCLNAFNNASIFEEDYKLRITEEGVLDYLIEFLQSEDNPTEIKQLCFTIIANLCKGSKKNKKLFREKNGIQLVINYLRNQNIAVSNRYLLLGLSLLNCLWNSVLGSRRSEEIFITSQGLYQLLQFIEICQYSHRKMALSSLCYLMENSKAIPDFLEWNSEKTMINATQLLIKIYQEEDDKYGVKYQHGVIVNTQRPIQPHPKPNSSAQSILKDFTQPATQTYLLNRIKEVVGEYDLRLIVFSVLFRVGFNKNDLNAAQQQKIQMIQMYPHFKMGEIWGEIKQQLKEESISPIEDDRHWMETSIEQFQQQMSNCVNTQALIMKEFHKSQDNDLTKFYQILKTNKHPK